MRTTPAILGGIARGLLCVASSVAGLAAGDAHAQPRGDSGAIPVEKPAAVAPDKSAAAKLKQYVAPKHPEGVDREAQVTLVLEIDAEGKVTSAKVLSGAGDGFDEAAVEAGKQLLWDPERDANGTAIPVRLKFRFTFSLKPKAPDPTETPTGTEIAPEREGLSGVVLGEADAREGVQATEIGVANARLTLRPRAGGDARVVVTDAEGRFDFGDVAPGTYDLAIEAAGFGKTELVEEITEGSRSVVKYRVFVASGGLEVTIRGQRPPREVVKRTITRREIDRVPGTNGDAIRSIQNLPGVARPPGIAGILIVRGSGPQDTQTFVDGTLVPLIFHFGGLSSVIPTELLEKIDFYPGNFGSEYGRVTGGIVDVGIRSPKDDGYKGLAQIDLIDARALVEGPIPLLDGWTFIAAARRSYIDAWLGPTLEAAGASVTQAPVYYDYQLFVEHNSASAGRFRVGFFGSDDRLELLVADPAPGEPALSGNVGLSTSFQRLQFLYENDWEKDSVRSVLALGRDDIGFRLGSLFFLLENWSVNARFEHKRRLNKQIKLNSGLDLFTSYAEVGIRFPEPNARPGQPASQPFSTRPLRDFAGSSVIVQPAIYTELEIEPIPSLRLVPGIRLDHSSINENELVASPRFSGRYAVRSEFPKTSLKSGVGVFHQPPAPQQAIEGVGTPSVRSNRAIHYALGFEQEFTRQIDLSVEGFVKQLDDFVIGNASPAGGGSIFYDNRASGYTAGGEFLLRYKPDDRFFGWLAYTLSRSTRKFGPDAPEDLFIFDQTHILTVLGSYRLGHGWEFGARFRLVSGNLTDPSVCNPLSDDCNPNRTNALFNAPSGAYVPIPLGNNTERLPLFHALDLRVDKKWRFDGWSLSTYLDVQNVYNNQNSEGIGYNFNFTARQFVNGLPILPSIGIRGDFGE